MRRKLTLSIDEEVYNALYQKIPPRGISKFIEDTIRPYLISDAKLAEAYMEASFDEEREFEAEEWTEALLEGVDD